MARPAKYRCPECHTTGSGGTGPRKKLQIKYKDGEAITIYCKSCGTQGSPASKRWLTPAFK